MNKSLGPGGRQLFEYSAEPPTRPAPAPDGDALVEAPTLAVPAVKAAAVAKALPAVKTLEGADNDATMTKVVERKWYERNKHIYPASTWQEFDPEKDYSSEVRRDNGGNTFFFSK